VKVLVTGASKGIGRAMVRELIASGSEVWGVARTSQALAALQQELGSRFKYTVADLVTQKGMELLVKEMDGAGFYPSKVFLIAGAYSTDDETFSTQAHSTAMLETNFHAPVRLFEALIKRHTPPKHVLVVSSVFALLGDGLNPTYAEAKAQVANYFVAANGKEGISTKVVYLGPVNTAINRFAKRGKSIMAIEPGKVAKFLMQLPEKNDVAHVFPRSATIFYQIFRYLPTALYHAVMNKARR